MGQRNTPAYPVALGGILAALAVTLMSLGGLIPVATYVGPLLCTVLLQVVLNVCGRRISWAWYGAVAILSVLLSPDKEAAGVFAALGYYPILKPWFDRRKPSFLWKAVYFNLVTAVLYWLLLHLFGMPELKNEFAELGRRMLAVLLLLGNFCFFTLDRLLGMPKIRALGNHGR